MEVPEVYAEAHRRVRAQIDTIRSKGGSFQGFGAFVKIARALIDWTIRTREFPTGIEKDFEKAARVFGTMKSAPSNVLAWYDRNRAQLDLLLEAGDWPEKTTRAQVEQAQVTKIGSFHLHNTVGTFGDDFDTVVKRVERVEEILRSHLDFERVLYGNVYLVRQIKSMRILAWYAKAQDETYVRLISKREIPELESSILHELGHRYWYRMMKEKQRVGFAKLYSSLRSSLQNPVSMPKVGDSIQITVRGQIRTQKIVSFDRGIYHTEGGLGAREKDVRRHIEAKAALGRFPSAYSMKSVEEFFPECFEHYGHETLKPDLRESFEALLSL